VVDKRLISFWTIFTMIESVYWKEDLLKYAEQFKPVLKPPKWSERLQVNFEKDVIISFFMVRKLIESNKLSSKLTEYKVKIYRSPVIAKVDNKNFFDIENLYDLESEVMVSKKVVFVCNQFIHGGATYAYREKDRNWGGLYTCSDFERNKYVYRIPLSEVIKILETAGNDYPDSISYIYSESKDDYDVKVDFNLLNAT
jgi:hypothetical protein